MNNPLRGIGLVLAATAMFSVSDVLGKHLVQSLPAIEIGWLRYVSFVAVAVAMEMGSGWHHHSWLRTRSPMVQFLRGLGTVISAIFFVAGTRYLPLAEATSISFVSPVLITVLSVPVLHETVGLRRWMGVAAGMLGVLVVIRPGTEAFQPAALITLTSSLGWSMASVLTRKIAGDRATTTMLWASLTGFVVLSLILPAVAVWPTPMQCAEGLLLGLFSAAGQYLLVLAYRQAAASSLAPFFYLQLIYSVGLGWAVFGNLPDAMTLLGAAIIIGSGLFNANCERKGAR